MSQELPTENLDNYMPLSDIMEYVDFEGLDVSKKQLVEWARKGKNDFPEPITLGRYKLYDKDQVVAWVTLWSKVSKNMGHDRLPNSRKANGQRTGS